MSDADADRLTSMSFERDGRLRTFRNFEDRFWYEVYQITERGFPVSEAAQLIGCTRQHVRQRTMRYRDQGLFE